MDQVTCDTLYSSYMECTMNAQNSMFRSRKKTQKCNNLMEEYKACLFSMQFNEERSQKRTLARRENFGKSRVVHEQVDKEVDPSQASKLKL
ncbi:unnamed protein product [Moneuplotes crassus]|uniref:Uncharacterized protein n=1 Tax=Euplotes crassus TaxID=5936 RepID=A0AAD2D7M8_EUPCR|nr:unnamed protein product [Moneuplotes crassus]